MKKSLHLFFQEFQARNMFWLFVPIQCAFSDIVRFSSEFTLSSKTVAFIKITCQTFCSYAVAFVFSKTTKFDFLLWLCRPTQKDNFSFLIFHFSVKNWNYFGTFIKETDRNSKHIILLLGLNDISEVQRSLPYLRYEEFSGVCSVLKYKCIYNLVWVTIAHRRA